MTVQELRRLLKSYPDGMLVLRGDNSGGYEAIYEPRQEGVTESSNPQEVQVVIVE